LASFPGKYSGRNEGLIDTKAKALRLRESWVTVYHVTMDHIQRISDKAHQNKVVDELLRVRKCVPGTSTFNSVKEAGILVHCISSEKEDSDLELRMDVLRYAMFVGDEMEYVMRQKKADGFTHMLTKLEIAAICLLHNEMRIGENLLTRICQGIKDRYGTIEGNSRVEIIQMAINKLLMSDIKFREMCAEDVKMLNKESIKEELDTTEYTTSWHISVEGHLATYLYSLGCHTERKSFWFV
jgi:hypothetical protein